MNEVLKLHSKAFCNTCTQTSSSFHPVVLENSEGAFDIYSCELHTWMKEVTGGIVNASLWGLMSSLIQITLLPTNFKFDTQ